MIPYIEIIDKTSLKPFAMIEPSECWFEITYNDVGECQLYTTASKQNLTVLQKGHYIKIPNKNYLWVITSIQYTFSANGTKMISAKGKEAKWLLNKRIILEPYEMPQLLDDAIYNLIYNNLGAGATADRKINGLTVSHTASTYRLDNTQATRSNILSFVMELCKAYNVGFRITYNGGLNFSIYEGISRVNEVKFSQSADNLLTSTFISNDENLASFALVVSKIEDVNYTNTYSKGLTGIDRSEILINSNLSTTYIDTNGDEQTAAPTSVLYQNWQVQEAKQELTKRKVIEDFDGTIDLQNSMYKFDVNYRVGDIVKIKDEYFNLEKTKRIIKYTIAQAADKYSELAEYGE